MAFAVSWPEDEPFLTAYVCIGFRNVYSVESSHDMSSPQRSSLQSLNPHPHPQILFAKVKMANAGFLAVEMSMSITIGFKEGM